MKAASLTASLLARKGEARPAMRRSALGIPPKPTPPSFNTAGEDAPAERPRGSFGNLARAEAALDPQQEAADIQSQILAAEEAAAEEAAAEPVDIDSAMQQAMDVEVRQPEVDAPATVPEGIEHSDESPLWSKAQKERPKQVQHTAGEPRIHTSLRLEESLHMRLRLHAARHHRSLQVVMLEALYRYLDAEEDEGAEG